MVDPEGFEWFRASDMVDRVPGVSVSKLKVWVHRNVVRSWKVNGERWICLQDVIVRQHQHAKKS